MTCIIKVVEIYTPVALQNVSDCKQLIYNVHFLLGHIVDIF